MLVCVAGTWWMWLVWLRPLGPSCACRVNGCSPGRRPVNVWCIGADWMTRSLANCDADGALIESPGGGPFRREVVGVRIGTPNSVLSCGRADSLPSCALPGFWPLFLASMICRCWSRTFRLRCSCSCMPGSFVWKPGDRHDSPISCITKPADSREVNGADGRAVCGPRAFAILDVRSSLLGRGRDDGMAGEPGSFLTCIMGGGPFL